MSRVGDVARGHLPRSAITWVGVGCLAVFVLIATLGQLHGSPTELVTAHAEAPSLAHPFGTDTLGRDLLARTASGAWLSALISVSAIALSLMVAVPLGLLAGSRHGRATDTVIVRVLEVFQALPSFVLVVFLLGLLQTADVHIGPWAVDTSARVALCLAIAFIPFFARVTRAATTVEMQLDYVDGLQGIGVSRREILTREVFVNVAPAIGVQALLALAIAIFAEGGLSFLGLGVAPPQATLGNLIADASSSLFSDVWWYALIPGTVMVIGILGCNLVGDSLHDTAVTGRAAAPVAT